MILDQPDTLSGIAQVSFQIQRTDFAAPQANGRQGGVQAGWPLWGARFDIDRSDPDSADLWRAFFSRLRGRIRRFYGCDPTRMRPLAHRFDLLSLTRAGGGAFDGSATSWSQAIDADGEARITLTGLPAGLTLSVTDYIGFKWDAAGAPAGSHERRTMAQVVVPSVANASGQLTAIVEPPIDTDIVPANAVAHLDDPKCVMQLVPDQSQLGPIVSGGVLGGATIVAIQDLRP